MPIHKFLALCLGLIAALAAVPADAKKPRIHRHPVPAYISVTDLTDPVQAAIKARAQGRNVIVVFDIDNTLLTMPQDLGGDAWFNWQKSLETPGTPEGDAAFAELIRNNSLFLQTSRMVPTQPDAPALITRLQAAHIPVYALSARSSDVRGPTEAALRASGIDLHNAPECGPPLCTRRGALGDGQIRHAARMIGLRLPDKPYANITVSDGVMMVTGQDKGVMLNLLLRSLKGGLYSDVFFVDDTFRNIENVQKAAPYIAAWVHPYSYERYWPDAKAFMSDTERQAKAQADFTAVQTSLCAAVRATICPLQ